MNRIISNHVSINRNHNVSAIYAIPNSGKIIYRNKIDTIIGIKHPGIVLGIDSWGTVWVIHNHYKIGYVEIVTWDEFSMGAEVFYDNREANYNTTEIIERAINHWVQKSEYHWLYNNCQHFVNDVSKGNNSSETIDKVSDNAILGGGITALFGILTGNKTLTNIGLGITAGGIIGKGLNGLK